jgi:hypothetical protein
MLVLLGVGAFVAYKLFAGKATAGGSVAQEGQPGFVGPTQPEVIEDISSYGIKTDLDSALKF